MPSVASETVEMKKARKKTFNVLSVGRFVPLKGFDVTIRSFAKFYREMQRQGNTDIRLTLVGGGQYKDALLRLSRKLGIAHAVICIDWIKRSGLQEIYRGASVFLFPSHEGAGMVVAEAMSYGLPVLCFDNVGPGEFVAEGCGRKVPYAAYQSSVEAFANHLKELYQSDHLLQDLSKQARRHFEENFAWDVRGEQLGKVYFQVAAKDKLSVEGLSYSWAEVQ